MNKKTVDYIRNYCKSYQHYVRGKYYYKVRESDGAILRCKDDEVGRQWFDHDGNRCDGWKVVPGTANGR